MKTILLLSTFLISRTVWGASWIVPGAVWYDTAGKKIDAHGGGVVQRGSTWYWIGYSASDRTDDWSIEDQTPLMYQSTDLVNWENLGEQAPSVTGMWRPKFASPNGSSFWLYGQQDRNVLSLSSSQFVGGYSQKAKGLLPPNKYSYSDTGMFFDKATSYLMGLADCQGRLRSPRHPRIRRHLLPPRLGQDGLPRQCEPGLLGDVPRAGPWTGPSDIAPPTEKTYGSQNTYAFAVEGSRATTHVYMGDAWDSKGSAASNYVWLPVAIDAGARTVALQYHAMWKVDPGTGVVSFPATRKRYAAAEAEKVAGRDGAVVPLAAKRCLSDDNVCAAAVPATNGDNNNANQQRTKTHRLRTGDEVTFRNVTGRPGTPHEWVSVRYTVNDPDAGEAYVKVNDQTAPVNLSEYNSRAGYHHTVPVRLRLDEGDVNTITLGAVGAAGFEMEVEGLELHEDD
ncbi:Arabinanase/levansucrase/invertase [Apiospora hydei]|uniref:Arabinanase/levansucrase/invertase n=1 Tax=Apiospora hydei TaxID=1337664 RepID=A0ABR1XD88_9PEZI